MFMCCGIVFASLVVSLFECFPVSLVKDGVDRAAVLELDYTNHTESSQGQTCEVASLSPS